MLMTSIWALIAIITAVGSPKNHWTQVGSVVIAFSWINVFTHGMSAGVAFFQSKMDQDDDKIEDSI